MKVKVLKQFRDKETGKLRNAGETFTCSQDRYKEILAKGKFVEEIAEKKTAEKTTKKAAETKVE